jgi:hypothetical protein
MSPFRPSLEGMLDDAHNLVRARSGEEDMLLLLDGNFAVVLLDMRMRASTGTRW